VERSQEEPAFRGALITQYIPAKRIANDTQLVFMGRSIQRFYGDDGLEVLLVSTVMMVWKFSWNISTAAHGKPGTRGHGKQEEPIQAISFVSFQRMPTITRS
jgi:hypothetical protein